MGDGEGYYIHPPITKPYWFSCFRFSFVNFVCGLDTESFADSSFFSLINKIRSFDHGYDLLIADASILIRLMQIVGMSFYSF